jgi:hypothetical protein
MRVGQLWHTFDDLALAVQATGFEVPQSRAEGYLMRLGQVYAHCAERARKERGRG